MVLVIVRITFACTVILVVALTTPTVMGTLYRLIPEGITTLAGNDNAEGFELVNVTVTPPAEAALVRYKVIAALPWLYVGKISINKRSGAGTT